MRDAARVGAGGNVQKEFAHPRLSEQVVDTHLGEPARLLRLAAARDERRPAVVQADEQVTRPGRVAARGLLVPDHLLHQRQAAAPVRARPRHAGPAAVVLDALPVPVECGRRLRVAGAAHEHDELFAAEAIQPIVEAERRAHQARQQQQNLVADQMSVPVVDGLEVVDIDHAKVGVARGRVVAARLGGGRLRHASQRRHLVERIVEGLAVEQPGQTVAFAVVEQALHIAIDAHHVADHAQLLGIQICPALDLENADHVTIGQQRKVGPVRRVADLQRLLLPQALQAPREGVECGQRLELGPYRVGLRCDIARAQAGADEPALIGLVADTMADRHRDRPQQITQHADERGVQDVAVAKPSQLGQVVNDL